jgi:hypothetical protein
MLIYDKHCSIRDILILGHFQSTKEMRKTLLRQCPDPAKFPRQNRLLVCHLAKRGTGKTNKIRVNGPNPVLGKNLMRFLWTKSLPTRLLPVRIKYKIDHITKIQNVRDHILYFTILLFLLFTKFIGVPITQPDKKI